MFVIYTLALAKEKKSESLGEICNEQEGNMLGFSRMGGAIWGWEGTDEKKRMSGTKSCFELQSSGYVGALNSFCIFFPSCATTQTLCMQYIRDIGVNGMPNENERKKNKSEFPLFRYFDTWSISVAYTFINSCKKHSWIKISRSSLSLGCCKHQPSDHLTFVLVRLMLHHYHHNWALVIYIICSYATKPWHN